MLDAPHETGAPPCPSPSSPLLSPPSLSTLLACCSSSPAVMLASKSMLGSSLVLVLAAATAAVVADHAACKANSLETSYPAPKAADGWSYRLVANNLTKPRSIVFDRRGGLLVVDSGVGLFHFSFEDNGGTCLSVDRKTTLVENKEVRYYSVAAQIRGGDQRFFTPHTSHPPLGRDAYPYSHWSDPCSLATIPHSSPTVLPSLKMAAPFTPPRRTRSTPGPTTPRRRAPCPATTAAPSSPT